MRFSSCSLRLSPVAAVLALVLAGCSSPPPSAPEPTGEEVERAWRIAAGEDPLEQTLAEIYSMALNAHEQPSVVVTEDSSTAELAASLIEDDEAQEPEELYEIVLVRVLPLAEQMDIDGGESDDEVDQDPAELVEMIREAVVEDAVFEPTAAQLTSELVLTSITAEELELTDEAEPAISDIAQECEDLVLGYGMPAADAQKLLVQEYSCEPDVTETASEEELIDQLIRAEIDTALVSSLHPGIAQNALVRLADDETVFPVDQYAHAISTRVVQQAPDVLTEVSQRLDDEALVLLRRLISGEQGLDPEEAAEYWLVEEGLLAEPEGWG